MVDMQYSGNGWHQSHGPIDGESFDRSGTDRKKNGMTDNDVTAPVRFDAIVVGAGMGGLYAIKRLRDQGLSVLGLEGGTDVGGVWYHNSYPGARVDVESIAYSYHFDPELYREWVWKERYAAQPDLLAYLQHVADRYDLRRDIHFSTWMSAAHWNPDTHRYTVRTDTGELFESRFLIMATGQLSKARKPDFAGLDDFTGRWLLTSHWPKEEVDLRGKRVGVIGTGSSGVQVITQVSQVAAHLTVFQRTANYVIPAQNGPMDLELHSSIASDVPAYWDLLQTLPGGAKFLDDAGPAGLLSPEEQQSALEAHWAWGGHGMNRVFSDQNTDPAANELVSEFVRSKVRQLVKDPETAEKLVPTAYPIGTRRIGVGDGFYEAFNRDNVTLVDVNDERIERITATGVQTSKGHHDLDVIIFALGFDAFSGALDSADITNESGQHPTDNWKRGARAYLGLMTAGFPNMFLLTGPGSPAVLSNMIVSNVQHADYVAEMIAFMDENGYDSVDTTAEAEERWLAHVAELSEKLIRRKVPNYMAHYNADDDSYVFIPYPGGYNNYLQRVFAVRDAGYEGFVFSSTD